MVFGDIHLADVRAWYEDRVTAAGLKHIEPIWGEPPAKLVREFVETGGMAVVTRVDLSRLDSSWLGRTVDERFVDEIVPTGVDPWARTASTTPSRFRVRCSLPPSAGNRAR